MGAGPLGHQELHWYQGGHPAVLPGGKVWGCWTSQLKLLTLCFMFICSLQNQLRLVLRDYNNLPFRADINLYCMYCRKSEEMWKRKGI